ncbi:MAG: NAD-dependent malic enzyme [Fidelibacterota bacterium]
MENYSNKPPERILPKGTDLLLDPLYNKGTAFTERERKLLNLEGLLPPHTLTLVEQKAKVLETVRSKNTDIEKYIYLMSLQDRNETLFYRLITEEIEEFLPIIYTPTVGQACQEYGIVFRRPRGMYISLKEKGSVKKVLRNWRREDVDVIVITDGERILGLGDLGADGMGIPVGKLSLYTVCSGIHPGRTLPVTIDVGTNNEELLNNPYYFGLREKRTTGKDYDELIDEFMEAASEIFPNVLIQFEDFANQNAYRLLEKYRNNYFMFNDDIQGTGSVVLAGLLTAVSSINSTFRQQRILFYGAGSAALGIAENIIQRMEMAGISNLAAREKVFLFDSRGLVVKGRDHLTPNKEKYAHQMDEANHFYHAVKQVKPTMIIGVSGQPKVFTKEVVEEMARLNEHPVIFALSNPTNKSECSAEEAYKWSDGNAIFASGSPFDPVEYRGKTFYPGQGNNAYIFPGVGLGVVASKSVRVTDEMFIIAAQELAKMVTQEDINKGRMYPSLTNIREISLNIAIAVAEYAFENNLTQVPIPDSISKMLKDVIYEPEYKSYI